MVYKPTYNWGVHPEWTWWLSLLKYYHYIVQ
jgi:hypothetical protein